MPQINLEEQSKTTFIEKIEVPTAKLIYEEPVVSHKSGILDTCAFLKSIGMQIQLPFYGLPDCLFLRLRHQSRIVSGTNENYKFSKSLRSVRAKHSFIVRFGSNV